MGRPIFEIAKNFRDKIEGDLDFVNDFRNDFRDGFISDAQIPEKLSLTRLNNLENQYDTQDLLRNGLTDLETSRNNSIIDLENSRYKLGNLEEDRQYEEEKRRLELKRLEIEGINYETEIESYMFDEELKSIKGLVPRPALDEEPYVYYGQLYDMAEQEGASEEVITRIDVEFADKIRPMLSDIDSFNLLINELLAARKNDEKLSPFKSAKLVTLSQKIDVETLLMAEDRGLISSSVIPDVLMNEYNKKNGIEGMGVNAKTETPNADIPNQADDGTSGPAGAPLPQEVVPSQGEDIVRTDGGLPTSVEPQYEDETLSGLTGDSQFVREPDIEKISQTMSPELFRYFNPSDDLGILSLEQANSVISGMENYVVANSENLNEYDKAFVARKILELENVRNNFRSQSNMGEPPRVVASPRTPANYQPNTTYAPNIEQYIDIESVPLLKDSIDPVVKTQNLLLLDSAFNKAIANGDRVEANYIKQLIDYVKSLGLNNE